jgi:hypothetical protein
MRVHPSLALLLFFALGGSKDALATDTWSDPFPGVRRLHRTDSGPREIFALVVDLCERGVSVRATAESERRRTVSSFGGLVGAQGAINGDFFSYTDYYPIGLAMSAGTAWHADNTTLGFLAVGGDRAEIRPEAENWSTPAAWMSEAVGGYPVLVSSGVAGTSFSAPDHCPSRHPRSAVGLSRDRQTLYLVVVDGRSSASIGMTCPELAVLMRDLGAWTALNLDGGGSSALWDAASGVLNDPSDGAERTVSNHLAVLASGVGAPTSCDFWQDEVVVDAALLDGGSTDVNGDGRADLCGRDADGFFCLLADGEGGWGDSWRIPDLSDANGWDDETNYATIRMGDVNGDGRADLCARGDDRVWCWLAGAASFGEPFAGPTLSDESGWGDLRYASTLRLADFDGDGDDDACARASAGFQCWPSHGDGFDAPVASGRFDDAGGWNEPDHYGTIRMGDIDGDGRADVCARGHAGMHCYRSDGATFPTSVSAPLWSDEAGWAELASWSTIRLADLDGDGRADLCGRGPSGELCHLSEGEAFASAAFEIPDLADTLGWADHDNYATHRLGDVDGDGDLDLCVRGTAGTWCHPFTGEAFGALLGGPALSDATGWTDFRFYSTIRLADVDASGAADLCARSAEGLRCWRSVDGAFVEGPLLSALDDASGWDAMSMLSTLRLAGGRRRGGPDSGDTDDDSGEADDSDPSDGGTGLDITPRFPGKEGGCACAAGGTPRSWLLSPLLGLLVLSRRRVSAFRSRHRSASGSRP